MTDFDGVLQLLESGYKNLSDFHLHTSGRGVTIERAKRLREAGLTAAAVGLDDVDPVRHDRLRGVAGAHAEAVAALEAFHAAGVFTYVNVCLSRQLIRAGDLWRYFELAKRLNVGYIQMLEPRPCGGYFGNGQDVLLTETDRHAAAEFFLAGNGRRRYADYPLIHYVAYAESPARLGCQMGGLSHLYIDSVGNVNPCVFLPVTFGNIREEDFPAIYERMRAAVPRPLHRQCPSLDLMDALPAEFRDGRRLPVPHSLINEEWRALIGN